MMWKRADKRVPLEAVEEEEEEEEESYKGEDGMMGEYWIEKVWRRG